MTTLLFLTVLLAGADTDAGQRPTLDSAIVLPELAKKADTSYLIRRWDRAVEQYGHLTAANPTVGLYWHRLGTALLETGDYQQAIAALERSNELGAFQWNPPRTVYRGESAWGLAAAHALAGHRDDAVRWTGVSLQQGLRDIRRFRSKHFESLQGDEEFQKLIWATDVKPLSRDEGFRHDLRFLLHESKRIHYAPFRSTSEAQLDALAAALDKDIPSLSDDQVFVRMMRIVRALGDGHTQIFVAGATQRLPIQLFQFPEGIFISAALGPQADLVGAKILKIGNRSMDDALDLAIDIASRDNPMTVRSFAPRLLCSLRVLRGLGIVAGDGPVPLEIEDAAGKVRHVDLPPKTFERPEKNWVYAVAGSEKPLPRCERDRAKTYWFEYVPEERIVYCQLNGIGTNSNKTLTDFAKDLFEAVEKPDVDVLVIDMRYNGGGDTFTNPPLINGIIRSDKLQKEGSLFVVIGRTTFSAAQNTVSELERRTKAILVGEPTGSNPNFIGESLSIVLPKSGWVASISDLWWQHSMAMDYRIWTPPHILAEPTAAAFRAHEDPSWQAILDYRKKKGRG